MEIEQKSRKNIALNYGLILGILGILQSVAYYALGQAYSNEWYKTVISIGLMVVVIVMGIKEYKKQNNGFLNLGQGLKTGIGIALIAGVISAVYTVIFAKFIEPNFVENIIELQKQQFLDNPDMSEDMIEMIGNNTRDYFYLFTIGSMLIFSIFLGFVVSLIASLVMQNKEVQH